MKKGKMRQAEIACGGRVMPRTGKAMAAVFAVSLAGMLLTGIWGCGSSSLSGTMAASDSVSSDTADITASYGVAKKTEEADNADSAEIAEAGVSAEAAEEDAGAGAEEGIVLEGNNDAALSGGAAESDASVPAAESAEGEEGGSQAEKKLIVTEYLEVETVEYDSFFDQIDGKVESLGGYIESSEFSGSAEYGSRYASLRIRIPAERLEEFVTAVDDAGTVTYDSKSTEDVTLQYVDLESHLKALRTEEETLLSLLEQAEKVSDIIEIQGELTEVRYQIESYESQLRVYDNQVDYSTVNLSVSEVDREAAVAEKGFWSEAAAQFSDSLYFLGQSARGFALWLIGSLPVLAVLALLLAGAVFLIRKFRRRRRRRREAAGFPPGDTEEKQRGNSPQ